MSRRPNIAFALTIPGAVRAFLLPHIRALIETYDVTVYSNFSQDPGDDIVAAFAGKPVRLVHIDFQRDVRLWTDLRSWWQLYRLLRQSNHSSLHSMMPKTGLLATTAGAAARVPTRIHMFTGQVWATKKGLSRIALRALDKVTAKAATHVLADSPSQRNFLLQNGFSPAIQVLGAGSVSGVDFNRFRADPQCRKEMRAEWGLDDDAIIFGFLGRLNHDKGIGDLCTAFEQAQLGPDCHLMLVGPDEQNIGKQIDRKNFVSRDRLHFSGSTNRPEKFLAMFDIFCLPSYREGFGTSVIEAAACGVPSLASRIYGLTDAVEDGVTGLLHPPGDIAAIAEGLANFATNGSLRVNLGKAASLRAKKLFSEGRLVAAMLDFYDRRQQ